MRRFHRNRRLDPHHFSNIKTGPFNSSNSQFEKIILGLIVVSLAALLGRCTFLQVGRAARDLHRQAFKQHKQTINLSASRGSILDCKNRVLAADIRATGVFADPEILADPVLAASKLAPILATPAQELFAEILQAKNSRFVWLKRNVPEHVAQQVSSLAIYGISLQSYQRRIYPQGSLAGQLLGFIGLDRVGLEGLERQFDLELTGHDGYRRRIADTHRRPLGSSAGGYRPNRDGANVVLTIDSAIQQITAQQLSQTCLQYKAKWGVALVMDPNSGQILAMANWPTFAPAQFRTTSPEFRRNRCLTDVYEPGSTFKPFIAAQALQASLFGPDEQIFCHHGFYRTGGRTLHDHGSGYDNLSFEDIVVKSSNIGMAIIGQRMGNAHLYRSLRSFGFGQATGIDLPGESPGIVAPLNKWTSYSTTSIPMGQEIGVTALQLLRAFSAIANDGLLYRPTIVREVISPDGDVFWRSPPQDQPQRVLSPEVAQLMRRRVLANVVERGTGTKAKILGWRVFGKTGTSQVPGPGGYLPDAFVASFIGGAPLTKPRLCVLVSVGQPDRSIGYYGGTVAAPAVGAILEQALAYLGVPPEPESYSDNPLIASFPQTD